MHCFAIRHHLHQYLFFHYLYVLIYINFYQRLHHLLRLLAIILYHHNLRLRLHNILIALLYLIQYHFHHIQSYNNCYYQHIENQNQVVLLHLLLLI